MKILSRLAERYRVAGEGRYVCTLCGATFDDSRSSSARSAEGT